ncbi:MAG TPA: hypothetical protein P5181_04245 [Dermatophilaceae bacterium]|nr:hypothetical protein [Dermatophilaceae bacterium]
MRGLVGLALAGEHPGEVEELCLSLLDDDDRPTLRAVALTCLGHVARINRSLDLDRVVPRLRALADDPVVGGRAQDALSDIEIFMPKS